MTQETSADGNILPENYVEARFGADENEQKQKEEREAFAELIFSGCGISKELANEMYDTRKMLIDLAVKETKGELLTHSELLLTLSLGKKMLHHDHQEGVIPFIARIRNVRKDLSVIRNHLHESLVDLVLQRFRDVDEMDEGEVAPIKHEVEEEVTATLDFCLEAHRLNTEYYRRFPSVGVIFSQDAKDDKKFRVGEQANYLTSWRGLPYLISASLVALEMLNYLSQERRSHYLGELCSMSLEELFDRNYLGYPVDPPHIPRYMERIQRTGSADQLLRSIVLVYGGDPAIVDARKGVEENEYQQFSQSQMAILKKIFSGEEDELV